jgi:hypothetical protein
LLDTTVILQQHLGLATLAEAERILAKKLRNAGVKRKGEFITARMLKSLRDHPKKGLCDR